MINISKRLKTIADFVKINGTVADIGCDHALTDIYIIKNNIAKKAIAMDIGEGPLDNAKNNIKKYDLTTQIEVRLSDGLEKLKSYEADSVIISGMGGNLIKNILIKGDEVIKTVSELILSPQSEPELVRKYLTDNDFFIDSERMIRDSSKYYVIIHALNKTSDYYKDFLDNISPEIIKKTYSEFDYIYGIMPDKVTDKVYYDFILHELNKVEKAIQNVENNAKDSSDKKFLVLYKKREYLWEVLNGK